MQLLKKTKKKEILPATRSSHATLTDLARSYTSERLVITADCSAKHTAFSRCIMYEVEVLRKKYILL